LKKEKEKVIDIINKNELLIQKLRIVKIKKKI
jgi:hypothetical protein